jgi:hypothetical protein
MKLKFLKLIQKLRIIFLEMETHNLRLRPLVKERVVRIKREEIKTVRTPKIHSEVQVTNRVVRIPREPRNPKNRLEEIKVEPSISNQIKSKQVIKDRNAALEKIKTEELKKLERTIILSIYQVPFENDDLDFSNQEPYLLGEKFEVFKLVEALVKNTIKPSKLIEISYLEHNLHVKIKLGEEEPDWQDKFEYVENIKLEGEEYELRVYYEESF